MSQTDTFEKIELQGHLKVFLGRKTKMAKNQLVTSLYQAWFHGDLYSGLVSRGHKMEEGGSGGEEGEDYGRGWQQDFQPAYTLQTHCVAKTCLKVVPV